MQTHLPSLFTALVAVMCAGLSGLILRKSQKRAARAEWMRLRDLAVMAEWVDSTTGTDAFPAPGSVAFYTLHPLAVWPVDYFPPNGRMDGKCPFPEHDLRVVAPVTNKGPVWAATCQLCAAHWTRNDPPPPLLVAQQIEHKLEALPGVRR